jgi:PqqD family protein of HPr-rel-A system
VGSQPDHGLARVDNAGVRPAQRRCWRAVPRAQLSWQELDGELVVRNSRSGSTHLLEPFAADVLRLLVESAHGMTVEELAQRLRDDTAPPDEWLAAAETLLTQFERLGLAECS